MIRAVRRRIPWLLEAARGLLAQIAVVEPSEAIRVRAALLEPVTVRSLDALHLATALEIGDLLDVVVTYDTRMAGAAKSLALTVVAPAAT